MFQFLNLDNASKAEKEILHTILFKDGQHKRKEFFKDLKPDYEVGQDVGTENEAQDTFGYAGASGGMRPRQPTPQHDLDNSDTSSAADINALDGEPGMHNDISTMSMSMRSQGGQQMRSFYTSAISAALPQNPHAGGGAGTHAMGHHPQVPMFHHPQMMQGPSGPYMPQYPVIPVQYGHPQAPHNIGLPTHLPPQQYMQADVPDIQMHQKLHDMHHSPGGGGPQQQQHASKYRAAPKSNRPRRNEETFHPHPQYYSNMGYPPPMFYTTQAVTNMTGTPLIMPGSGAPAPMYHQASYTQMYPNMMGNDQHMHQQQQQLGSSNINRPSTSDSPKMNENMSMVYPGATNGDPNQQMNENVQQRPENEDFQVRSNENTEERHEKPDMPELKVDTEMEQMRIVPHGPASDKSPIPPQFSPQQVEGPVTSAADHQHHHITATQPEPAQQQQMGEALNGSLTDSSTNSSGERKEQLPQPTSTSTEEIENVPNKPQQGPKSWSSTVNGGISPTPPVLPVQLVSPPPPAPTVSAPVTEVKSGEFPQLTATTASAMTTSTSSVSQSQPKSMSWASIASRQTVGGPTNGTSTTSQAQAGAKQAADQMSYYSSKQLMENDIGVGLYNSTPDVVYENDTVALKLGAYLANYVLDHHTFSLTPRGLSNQNNFCYINATLQALVACPPFVNLFRSLQDIIGKKPCKSTPIIQSMFDFIMEFEPITRLTQQRMRKTNDAFYVGANFEASGIRKVLGLLDGATFKVEGRQQDAEEFLSHLLNALHDEMIKVIKWSESKKEEKSAQSSKSGPSKEALPQPPPAATDEEDDSEQWQVMGPKNKGCMTRKTSLSKSPISEMFVGQMCSALNRPNTLKSTTLQPFFTLQLDIQSDNIHTIRDALDGLSVKEEVTGCVASNGLETEAWKQMSLEVLPSILILHMKRFVFDTNLNMIRKLDKRVDFSIDLEIAKDLLSINSRSKYAQKQRMYKLFAVVYHDGEEAIKGHYIADTFHPSGGSLWGQFGWIRYDDTAVKGVGENHILNPQSPRVPYLLYYRRVDTLMTKKDRS